MSGAKIAAAITSASSTRPSTASGLPMKSDAIRLAGVSSPATRLPFRFSEAHAGIERRAEDVHDQVDDDEHRDGHQKIGNDDRPIEEIDRIDQELAHPRPCEDRFG